VTIPPTSGPKIEEASTTLLNTSAEVEVAVTDRSTSASVVEAAVTSPSTFRAKYTNSLPLRPGVYPSDIDRYDKADKIVSPMKPATKEEECLFARLATTKQ
jgi:hypothetical protein